MSEALDLARNALIERLVAKREPELARVPAQPSNHPDPRMSLTLGDMRLPTTGHYHSEPV